MHMIMKEVINCKMIGLIQSRFDQNSRDIEWRLITFLSLQSSVSVIYHVEEVASSMSVKKKILTKI